VHPALQKLAALGRACSRHGGRHPSLTPVAWRLLMSMKKGYAHPAAAWMRDFMGKVAFPPRRMPRNRMELADTGRAVNDCPPRANGPPQ